MATAVRMVRRTRLAALVAAACAAACVSSRGAGGGSADRPLRVAYHDLRSGQRLALVNEAHTDRVALYSELRGDAGTKVGTNEVVAALVEFLDERGFADLALEGAPPSTADPSWLWTLEVQDSSSSRFVAMPRGLTAQQKVPYQQVWAAFLDTYNATYGLQAVEPERGREVFQAEPKKRSGE